MSEALINVGGLINYRGLASAIGEDPESGTLKRRWKYPRRSIDWQAFFQQMVNAGMTPGEISDKTGIPENVVNRVLRGAPGLQKWYQAIAALGVFTMNIGADVPLMAIIMLRGERTLLEYRKRFYRNARQTVDQAGEDVNEALQKQRLENCGQRF